MENAVTTTITVTLDKAWTEPVSVDYTVDDSRDQNGTVTFAPGSTLETFTVSISDDSLPELAQEIPMSLSTPVNATLGALADATLVIVDDETAPTIQFSASSYSAYENDGSATITVTLNVAADYPVRVTYHIKGNPGISDVLTFNPGQTAKTFEVLLTDDNVAEPDAIVPLSLSSPINATLGSPSSATLTIVDDDNLLTVQFGAGAYTVTESVGKILIPVYLSVESKLSVLVSYSVGGSIGLSGKLTFLPGELEHVITINIPNDDLWEEDEVIPLTLSSPTNAILGTPAEATLLVLNDDPYIYYFYFPVIRHYIHP
jgi:hypothetical protein